MTPALWVQLAAGLAGLGALTLSIACASRSDHEARLAEYAALPAAAEVHAAIADRFDRSRQNWLAVAIGLLVLAAVLEVVA